MGNTTRLIGDTNELVLADWPVASGSDVTCIGIKPWPRTPQSGSTYLLLGSGTNFLADEPRVEAGLKSWITKPLPPVAAKRTTGVAGPGLYLNEEESSAVAAEGMMVSGR